MKTRFRSSTDIEQRSFEFAAATVRLVQHYKAEIPEPLSEKVFLLGTAIGELVADAHVGNNTKRFHKRMTDARRRSRDIAYWLKILHAAEIVPQDIVTEFLDEAREIHTAIAKACNAVIPDSDPGDDQ